MKKERFFWTDTKVKIFSQILSLNFSSKIVDEEVFFYSNYKGKSYEEKMEQFKKDYKSLKSK
jgi:hypothetical protein